MEGKYAKIEEAIREVAATIIERESNKTALITITRTEVHERGKKATILFSVLPESKEESALNFLKRKRPLIREELKKRISRFVIPFVDVAIDKGEKARQTIDTLLRED